MMNIPGELPDYWNEVALSALYQLVTTNRLNHLLGCRHTPGRQVIEHKTEVFMHRRSKGLPTSTLPANWLAKYEARKARLAAKEKK